MPDVDPTRRPFRVKRHDPARGGRPVVTVDDDGTEHLIGVVTRLTGNRWVARPEGNEPAIAGFTRRDAAAEALWWQRQQRAADAAGDGPEGSGAR